MELLVQLILVGVLLTIGYVFGSAREQRHFQSIIQRQKTYSYLPTRTEKIRDVSLYADAHLVAGSVVIASDYFKNFVANLKGFFGGRLTTYESLMDRGRRESILRMKEKAVAWGADEILEVRIESAALDAIGIEMFAYGTAVKRKPTT